MKKFAATVGLTLSLSSIVLSLYVPVNRAGANPGQGRPTVVADGPIVPPPVPTPKQSGTQSGYVLVADGPILPPPVQPPKQSGAQVS
jgi:hypothetical protein